MAFAANARIVAITASGNDGNLPQNAVDGNISTRWSCSIPPNGECWLQADLGAPQQVSGASLGWYQGEHENKRVHGTDLE
jgi:F5/8 type C domain